METAVLPCRDTRTGDAARHWRWRGVLVDYYTADSAAVGPTPLTSADALSPTDIIHGEEAPLAALASEAEDVVAGAATAATEGPLQGDPLKGDSHAAAVAAQRPDAPAVLLVHGFGAFGEQWRGQILALTRAGYKVHLIAIAPHRRTSQLHISAHMKNHVPATRCTMHLISQLRLCSCQNQSMIVPFSTLT